MTRRMVRIDALPESASRYSGYGAIVCVDVLLSATTIVTALGQGRRVLAAPTAKVAAWVGSRALDPLLVTDALEASDDGVQLAGPSWLQTTTERARALVHVSPFAEMLSAAVPRARVYVACLRNLEATANELAFHQRRVVILAAGEDGEVCVEDQMVAAWLALRLRARGFDLEGRSTAVEVERWSAFEPSLVGLSRTAEQLRVRKRGAEVDFVLSHIDDLDVVCGYADNEFRDPAAGRRRFGDDSPTPAWGMLAPLRATSLAR